jgi:hypothetical protein
MNNRDTVLKLVKQLPPDISLPEIIRRIELLQSQLSELKIEFIPQTTGWLPGFFEEVMGGWVGEPLERTE